MNTVDFEKIVDRRLELIKATLLSKAKEYAVGDDRLHNFKAAARRLKCSPERALIGFKEKHEICIMDMIDDIEAGKFNRDKAYIDEKVGDAIVYNILLEACLIERYNTNENNRACVK